jgi:carbamoyltransferase
MKILGISPLDKDATVSLVEDGRVLFAAAEERFSRRKQHDGFPDRALEECLAYTGTAPEEIEIVAYPFLDWPDEAALIHQCFAEERAFQGSFRSGDLRGELRRAEGRVPERTVAVHGLSNPNQRMEKGWMKEHFYSLAGVTGWSSRLIAASCSKRWAREAIRDHQHWNRELENRLRSLGLLGKLSRYEHHLSHAANSYYSSGFDRALIVTLDGYGSGLAGSIGIGEGGKIRRLRGFRYPYSLGTYYETVTASLGFNPNRHAGKIVGLAAYGDPEVLSSVLRSRFDTSVPGTYRILQNLNVYFSRHLASRFPMVDVAAAYQRVLEEIASELVGHWIRQTGCRKVVLSGGVVANVKMNQRIHEVEGVEGVFVYPNMGDGGCGTGIAMHLSWPGDRGEPMRDALLGPCYGEEAIVRELEREGLEFSRPADLAGEVARRLHAGEVVARFGGRMEYGPRALGNRSILYHAREPDVNQWLNQRLGRTEFMPFAPVTLWEARHDCYENVAGAEHSAEFMTITFDCTERMRKQCPAAVHVDGTARPQLVRREVNPNYYAIVEEYRKLSGIPSLINTSFNMHEEPIVCTPQDAVRAFLRGHLDGLAIGPFYVPNPRPDEVPKQR